MARSERHLARVHHRTVGGGPPVLRPGNSGEIVFTNEASVDDPVAVTGHQSTVTRDARETVDVINVALCLHDEF